MDRFAVLRQAWRLVRAAPHCRLIAADRHMAGQAGLAMAAEHRQASNHVVTGLDVPHVGSDGLDDARRFVTQHDRHVMGIGAFDEMKVAVANTGRRRADQHLPWSRLGNVHVLDFERRSNFAEYRRFHSSPSPPRRRYRLGLGDHCARSNRLAQIMTSSPRLSFPQALGRRRGLGQTLAPRAPSRGAPDGRPGRPRGRRRQAARRISLVIEAGGRRRTAPSGARQRLGPYRKPGIPVPGLRRGGSLNPDRALRPSGPR